MSMCICKVTFLGFDTRKMNSFKLLEIYYDTFYFKVKTKNYWIFPLPTVSHSFLTWFKEGKISKSSPRVIKRAGVYCVSAFWTFIVNSSRCAAFREGRARLGSIMRLVSISLSIRRRGKGRGIISRLIWRSKFYRI